MDNIPLLYVFDADARQYVPDMTLGDAECIAVVARLDTVDVLADGFWHGYHLMCEKARVGYTCWISTPRGWTIGYRPGATPAEAIERAQAACESQEPRGYQDHR